MAFGKLRVEVFSAENLPIADAKVNIYGNGTLLFQTQTDASGQTDYMDLTSPDVDRTLDPAQTSPAYSNYDVEVDAPGFNISYIHDVEIVSDVSSTLPVRLIPTLSPDIETHTRRVIHNHLQMDENTVEDTDLQSDIVITPHGLTPDNTVTQRGSTIDNGAAASPEVYGVHDVYIPTNITVHLGTPSNSNARNVTVPFVDYIANVASSEIYPTWPTQALYANMFAITTYAINRIYTEWYRNRGYNFDITNNTAYDQYFVYGRNIYDNLREIANEIFDMYVRRIGFKNPLFTQYCSGTSVTCPGLSQWGTVDLAKSGMNALQILKYYYGNDIEITETDNVRAITESYPGTSMQQGNSSEHIKLMQNYLNRIRLNYPAIPNIENPNGYFGADTAAAVRKFQQVFSLSQDGVIGRGTWNKISQVYVGIVKLAELKSEGERTGIGSTPPQVTLSTGSTGSNVQLLQYILNYIGEYYDFVPNVVEDGVFGRGTANAVMEFQKNFGMPADGVVGRDTWNRLYDVYNKINANNYVPLPTTDNELLNYPNQVFKVGSSGSNVQYIQNAINAINQTYPKIPAVSIDGQYGPNTAASIKAFQEQFGLTPDGIVGNATWNNINSVLTATGDALPAEPKKPYPGTPLRFGSRGENVRYLQQRLGINADGIFGTQTANAVTNFQRRNGLTPDGIVGPATWALL
ncbi:MAG: peptidoglycan-binding protein [Christensenellaceae bacterium]|jgi:peptidoglycan hydrolase-like protein with peptidoglycan-binding domain|nr:peptidoglycan-binding protein [Christensenellaceae bacterium]